MFVGIKAVLITAGRSGTNSRENEGLQMTGSTWTTPYTPPSSLYTKLRATHNIKACFICSNNTDLIKFFNKNKAPIPIHETGPFAAATVVSLLQPQIRPVC